MNVDRVEAILQLLHRQEYVGEVEVEGSAWRLKARKLAGLPGPSPAPEPEFQEAPLPEPHRIRSRWVGVFRASHPLPEAGAHLSKGTPLGHVESMRVLNPVVVDEEGYFLSTRVEDGEAVEYGQELFVLSPDTPSDGEDGGGTGRREEG